MKTLFKKIWETIKNTAIKIWEFMEKIYTLLFKKKPGGGGGIVILPPYTSIVFESTAGTTVSAVRAFTMNGDGTMVYLATSATKNVQYASLSTPYDISTLGSLSTYTFTSPVFGLFFRNIYFGDSGNKLYLTAGGTIYEFDLSTPYDITTESFVQSSPSLGGNIESMSIVDDRLYVNIENTKNVKQYSLSANWNISAPSLVHDISILSTTGAFDDNIENLLMINDGQQLLITERNDRVMGLINLSTPYDISTMRTDTFDVSVVTNPIRTFGVAYSKADGSIIYHDYDSTSLRKYLLS